MLLLLWKLGAGAQLDDRAGVGAELELLRHAERRITVVMSVNASITTVITASSLES